MSSLHFVSLGRAVAVTMSRRTALRRIGGGLATVTALAVGHPVAAAQDAPATPAPQDRASFVGSGR